MRIDEHVSELLIPALYRLTGRPFLSMLRELREAESLTEEELAEVQFDRLSALLAHCYANVPFYRSMFDETGAHPSDIRTLADYSKLPTIDKETVNANIGSLVASDHGPERLRARDSGGSTGAPVQLYHDSAYSAWGWASFLRNVAWTGHRPGERQAWLTRPTVDDPARKVRLAVERRWLLGVADQSEKTLARWADEMLRRRPRFVYGYPSAVSALATHLIGNGIELGSVRQVMVTSETLFDDQRERIERAFGVPVFNQYGATEAYSIASECECGSMHVNSDINVVEFGPVDPKLGERDSAEIVVTPLLSYGMPLLRYRIGDEGGPMPGGCECGLPFPRMRMDVGRIADLLEFYDGTVVSSLLPERLLWGVPGVARYQFRQTSPEEIELLMVKDRDFGESTWKGLADVEDRFEEMSGVRVRIRTTVVDDIPLTAAGKHKYVIGMRGGSLSDG